MSFKDLIKEMGNGLLTDSRQQFTESASLFCEGPDGKYFRLRIIVLCTTIKTLPLWNETAVNTRK